MPNPSVPSFPSLPPPPPSGSSLSVSVDSVTANVMQRDVENGNVSVYGTLLRADCNAANLQQDVVAVAARTGTLTQLKQSHAVRVR